jgi:rhodanese-related sulfurtransferase
LLEKAKVIRLINSSEAKDFFNKNDALFLDARDSWEYSDSRIFNAVNIPEYNFNPNNPIIKLLDKNGIYITYCSASDCDLSRNLATKLKSIGFKNVLVYSEGIEKWLNLDYPF